MRYFLRGALAALAFLFIVSCGGGDDNYGSPQDPAPAQSQNQVELHADVLNVSPAEAQLYTIVEDDVLDYAGTAPPRVGQSFILNGAAHKVVESRATGQQTRLTTTIPDFQEIFAVLRFTLDEPIAPTEMVVPMKAPKAGIRLDDWNVSNSFGGGILAVQARFSNGRVRAKFDYSRDDGLKEAELFYDGTLTFGADVNIAATVRAKEGIPVAKFASFIVPQSLGLVRGEIPVEVVLGLASKVEVTKLLSASHQVTFSAGARYNRTTGAFENGSSIQTSQTTSVVPDDLLKAALLAIQNVLTGAPVMAATGSVALSVGPELVAALRVGVLGISASIGPEFSWQVSGVMPNVCNRVPIARVTAVTAGLNFHNFRGGTKKYEHRIFAITEPIDLGDRFKGVGNCAPVVGITENRQAVAEDGLPVQLVPTLDGVIASPAGYQFTWTLHDGKTSSEPNPVVKFLSPGDYPVSVKIVPLDANGAPIAVEYQGSAVIEVRVIGKFSGSFGGDDSGTFNLNFAESGAITGSARSTETGDGYSIKGNLATDGKFSVAQGEVTGGASFSGQLLPGNGAWTVRGTWSNPGLGEAGTFSGSQAPG
ncbi:PKD domain-containing protein [Cupriavidus numazuensis]|uniref:PKD domain-containing protein n=1 Tax=Cupriavidus numazuensis TaxID=221992 RepID=A0ABN7QAW5_9BURK|nr:PKD domain-containing protein [Cupriavidus numazuensis]CAG2160674.1 hypothetical protein LMG26411_07664 [Cupriavidus numazuensis]